MNFYTHCDLCEHEKTSLKIGVTCTLTKRKPDFKNTCTTIKLDQKFQEKLEIAYLELEEIRSHKKSAYLFFCLLMIIGVTILIKSDYLAGPIYDDTYFWVHKTGIIALGISILTGTNFQLYRFRKKLKDAQQKKDKIDVVIEKYGISYKPELDFKEKVHGTQQVDVKLEFKNWTRKNTITTYEIDD
ncbi:hypothetical protein [uncultured Dokdonia sp.]|uniref:hypothetical protein n=1 Tax=uncultured Dokdonia sp. TaxID=575653 RepID=UPI002617A545|nr:hypothetical protein [uncultured Dokdonia sp.]